MPSKAKADLVITKIDDVKVVFTSPMPGNIGRYSVGAIILIEDWRAMGAPDKVKMTLEAG